ncbi:hypothetical protein BVX95_02030 [archaeon D22]|nr:hypothetical protein BVX95_02030 [archaeon D22]
MIVASMFIFAACTQTTTPTGKAIATGDVKEFEIESYTLVVDGKYYPQFTPQEIVVNKGDTVRLKVKVTSGTHDFHIDKFNVHTATPLDKETVVEFVADESGEFIMYCNMPGHRSVGHFGILNVKG